MANHGDVVVFFSPSGHLYRREWAGRETSAGNQQAASNRRGVTGGKWWPARKKHAGNGGAGGNCDCRH
jgi:hypothetical protein